MLDQVGEAALAFVFIKRAGVDPHPHRHLPRRHAVAPHGVAQAVGQLAEAPIRIGGDVAALVELARRARRGGAAVLLGETVADRQQERGKSEESGGKTTEAASHSFRLAAGETRRQLLPRSARDRAGFFMARAFKKPPSFAIISPNAPLSRQWILAGEAFLPPG